MRRSGRRRRRPPQRTPHVQSQRRTQYLRRSRARRVLQTASPRRRRGRSTSPWTARGTTWDSECGFPPAARSTLAWRSPQRQGGNGVFGWANKDMTFDWRDWPACPTGTISVSWRTNTVADYIDMGTPDLDLAKNHGAKILMWHGLADQLDPVSIRTSTTTAKCSTTTAAPTTCRRGSAFSSRPASPIAAGGAGTAAAKSVQHDGELGRERCRAGLDPLFRRWPHPSALPVSTDGHLRRRRRSESREQLPMRRKH